MWDYSDNYDDHILKQRAQVTTPHAPTLGYHRCHYRAKRSLLQCQEIIQVDNLNDYNQDSEAKEFFCPLHAPKEVTKSSSQNDLLWSYELVKNESRPSSQSKSPNKSPVKKEAAESANDFCASFQAKEEEIPEVSEASKNLFHHGEDVQKSVAAEAAQHQAPHWTRKGTGEYIDDTIKAGLG